MVEARSFRFELLQAITCAHVEHASKNTSCHYGINAHSAFYSVRQPHLRVHPNLYLLASPVSFHSQHNKFVPRRNLSDHLRLNSRYNKIFACFGTPNHKIALLISVSQSRDTLSAPPASSDIFMSISVLTLAFLVSKFCCNILCICDLGFLSF